MSWRDGGQAGGKGSDDHDENDDDHDDNDDDNYDDEDIGDGDDGMAMMILIQVKHCGGGDAGITPCQVNFIICNPFIIDMIFAMTIIIEMIIIMILTSLSQWGPDVSKMPRSHGPNVRSGL